MIMNISKTKNIISISGSWAALSWIGWCGGGGRKFFGAGKVRIMSYSHIRWEKQMNHLSRYFQIITARFTLAFPIQPTHHWPRLICIFYHLGRRDEVENVSVPNYVCSLLSYSPEAIGAPPSSAFPSSTSKSEMFEVMYKSVHSAGPVLCDTKLNCSATACQFLTPMLLIVLLF